MGLIASGLVLSRNSTLSGTFALSKPSFPYCRVPSIVISIIISCLLVLAISGSGLSSVVSGRFGQLMSYLLTATLVSGVGGGISIGWVYAQQHPYSTLLTFISEIISILVGITVLPAGIAFLVRQHVQGKPLASTLCKALMFVLIVMMIALIWLILGGGWQHLTA